MNYRLRTLATHADTLEAAVGRLSPDFVMSDEISAGQTARWTAASLAVHALSVDREKIIWRGVRLASDARDQPVSGQTSVLREASER